MNVRNVSGHLNHGLKCVLAEHEGAVSHPEGTSSNIVIEGNPVE